MKAWKLLLAALVWIVACGPASPTPNPDIDVPEEDPPYEGDTVGGVIPDGVPPEPSLEDAGEVMEDKRCCNVVFSISDLEPADAVGRVRGSVGPLAGEGVELVRAAGRWEAFACIPVGTSTQYWYEFTWQTTPADAGSGYLEPSADAGFILPPSADVDAGQVEGEPDGGELDAGPAVTVEIRAAEDQRADYNGDGALVNFLGSVDQCEALDASTGMRP